MIDLSTTLGRILSPTRAADGTSRDAFFRAATIAPAVRSWILEMRFKPQPAYSSGVFLPAAPATPRQPRGRPDVHPARRRGEPRRQRQARRGPRPRLRRHRVRVRPRPSTSTSPGRRRCATSARRCCASSSPGPGTCTTAGRTRGPARPSSRTSRTCSGRGSHRRGANVVVLRPDRYVAALCDARNLSGALASLRSLLGAGAAA